MPSLHGCLSFAIVEIVIFVHTMLHLCRAFTTLVLDFIKPSLPSPPPPQSSGPKSYYGIRVIILVCQQAPPHIWCKVQTKEYTPQPVWKLVFAYLTQHNLVQSALHGTSIILYMLYVDRKHFRKLISCMKQ